MSLIDAARARQARKQYRPLAIDKIYAESPVDVQQSIIEMIADPYLTSASIAEELTESGYDIGAAAVSLARKRNWKPS